MPDLDLDHLTWAMSDHSGLGNFYLDPATGQIHGDGDDLGTDDADSGPAENWLWIGPFDSSDDYRDMELFIDCVPDHHLRERLARAIEGRGAFRRFRDTLFRDPSEIGHLWSPFQDARRQIRAVEWLRGTKVYDDARADTVIAELDAQLNELGLTISTHGNRALSAIAAQERELQTPACRRNRARLEELLHDDFREIGASGRSWSRPDLITHLISTDDDTPIEIHDVDVRAIGDEAALVTWTSRRGSIRSARSSIWVLDHNDWRLLHHQGTLLPPL